MHQKEQKRESRGVSASVLERDRGKKRGGGGGGVASRQRGRWQAGGRGANGPRGDGARFDTIRSLGRGEARRHGGKERRPCRCLKLDRAIHSLLPSPSASPPSLPRRDGPSARPSPVPCHHFGCPLLGRLARCTHLPEPSWRCPCRRPSVSLCLCCSGLRLASSTTRRTQSAV